MELTVNDVKKQLYKSKEQAIFSHYVSGNLYYNVKLEDGIYQFPIETIEYDSLDMSLSSDLGSTSFYNEMKGSELNRWINMAIKSDEFIKIS